MWKTAKVYTMAEGFGEGMEVLEQRIIDIRPLETEEEALTRQGFDPLCSRIEVI